jgi:hypothetical protein
MHHYKRRTRQGNEELLDITETQYQKEGNLNLPTLFFNLKSSFFSNDLKYLGKR